MSLGMLVLLGLGFLLAFVLMSRTREKPLGISLAQIVGGLLLCVGLFMAFAMVTYKSRSVGIQTAYRQADIARTEARFQEHRAISEMERRAAQENHKNATAEAPRPLPVPPTQPASALTPKEDATSSASKTLPTPAEATEPVSNPSTSPVIRPPHDSPPTPASAFPAFGDPPAAAAAQHAPSQHPDDDFLSRLTWLSNIEAGPWAVLIMLVVGVFRISRFQFSAQRSVAVELPQTEPPFNYGWLILPVSCLAGLGYLAMPAFRPSPRVDTARMDQEFATRQQRMDKVLRETIDGSGRPGDEIQNIPDWLKNRSTTSDQILLTSEQFSTRKEAEDELLPFAAHLLQRTFHETHPWQGAWNVPLAQVRERVVAQQFYEQRKMTTGKFSGDIHRLHMLVNVSPSVAETFTENWKSQIVEHRLKVLGVLFGWLTCVLFTGSVFYRRAAHPENSLGWVHHLKLSGVTVGLTAAAAWVLMTYVA